MLEVSRGNVERVENEDAKSLTRRLRSLGRYAFYYISVIIIVMGVGTAAGVAAAATGARVNKSSASAKVLQMGGLGGVMLSAIYTLLYIGWIVVLSLPKLSWWVSALWILLGLFISAFGST